MGLTEAYLAKGEVTAALIDEHVVDVGLGVSLILYLDPYPEGTASPYGCRRRQINLSEQRDATAEPAMGAQARMLRVGGVELPHVVAARIGDGEAEASRKLFHFCLCLNDVAQLLLGRIDNRTVIQQQGIVDKEH